MKPTVGRIVHYTNLGDADGKYPPETQAAIITGAKRREGSSPAKESEFIVDLHIFYRTGQFDVHDVPFSETPERGHWHWPERVQ